MDIDVIAGLSQKDKAAFDELKSSINSNYGEKAAADDFRIYRFLKARDFDVKHAGNMLSNHLEWRKQKKVDTILQDYKPPVIAEKYYPLYILGFDLEGSPILVFEFGNTDFKGILKSEKRENVVMYVVYLLELCEHYLAEQSKKYGKRFDNWVVLFDFENTVLSQVTSKAGVEYLHECLGTYESNYPERLKTAYMINTSTYFLIIFSLVKRTLSAVTLNKLRVFGKDGWKEEILKIIDPKVLPTFLGGDIGNNPKPLTNMSHGGTVPECYYFKSSERRLASKPGVIKYNLKRNKKIEIPMEVEAPETYLEWQFETENYDVGFGLSYRKKGFIKDPKTVLIPVQRVDAHMQFETGTYMCEEAGTYILIFDNSHSWFRQKLLYCRVALRKPEEGLKTDSAD